MQQLESNSSGAETDLRKLSVVHVGRALQLLVVGTMGFAILHPAHARDVVYLTAPLMAGAMGYLIYWARPPAVGRAARGSSTAG
jgi:hypothetical protein